MSLRHEAAPGSSLPNSNFKAWSERRMSMMNAINEPPAPIRIDNPVVLRSDFALPLGSQKVTFGGPVTLAGASRRYLGGGAPMEFAGARDYSPISFFGLRSSKS